MTLSRRSVIAAALIPLAARAATGFVIEATSGPLAYAATRLAGDWATIRFRAPPDADPALWTPSLAEIGEIQRADLILLNGAGFAPWTGRVSLPRRAVVDASAGFAARLIAQDAAVTHSHGPEGAHTHAAVASFVWLDFTLAAEQARAVAAALAARAPDHAPDHAPDRAPDIAARLSALEADYATLDAAALDLGRRTGGAPLLAVAPRWPYFARRYGFAIRDLRLEAGAEFTVQDWAAIDAAQEAAPARLLLCETAPSAATTARLGARGLVAVAFDTGVAWRGGASLSAIWRDALAAMRAALAA